MQYAATTEKTPRGFNIDPRGKFLLAVGMDSASLTVHAIDQNSGELRNVKQYPMGKQPNWGLADPHVMAALDPASQQPPRRDRAVSRSAVPRTTDSFAAAPKKPALCQVQTHALQQYATHSITLSGGTGSINAFFGRQACAARVVSSGRGGVD